MRQLRDYQRECIAYLQAQWAAGITRPPAVLATGLGKTEIFTDPSLLDPFLDGKLGAWLGLVEESASSGKRVLIIAHTDELIEQAARKARRNNPGRRVGIVKAAVNQVTAEIIVSSRQTLAGQKRREQLRNIGLIIIDEAHHALRTNTYGKILEHFGAFCSYTEPDLKCAVHPKRPYAECQRVMVAGFTATLARGDKGKLSTVWQEPPGGLFKRDILFGIRRGYLLDVRGHSVRVPDMDLSRVKVTGGDFSDSSMAEELERTFAPEVIAKAYLEHAGERKGIAFWPLIDTAYHAAEVFNSFGIRSEVVHGDTSRLPKAERRAVLQRLHTGATQVVHSVDALNEGFDDPTIDVAVLGSPTKSAPRYQQRAGRVLRPDLTIPPEQRRPALIIDAVGAGARHDLRSLIDLAPERMPSEIDDDATLLQLEDEWVAEREASEEAAPEAYVGPVQVVEFDPLGRDRLWARTPGGAWYMSAGTVAYAFLVESVAGDPGHYDVVLCGKPQRGVQPWAKATEYVDMPLDMALGWAEELAIEVGGHGTKALTGRKSAWRREPAESKPRLLNYGRGMGVWREGVTAGELSEAIDARHAANTIDPLVKRVRELATQA